MIQSPIPVADHLCSERSQTVQGHREAVVAILSFNYRVESVTRIWQLIMHLRSAPLKEEHRIFRLSYRLVPYRRGISESAESDNSLPMRSGRCVLSRPPMASPPWMGMTRLNTQPARTPFNASSRPSLKLSHDSGPIWSGDPLLNDFSFSTRLPVYPGVIRRYINESVTLCPGEL